MANGKEQAGTKENSGPVQKVDKKPEMPGKQSGPGMVGRPQAAAGSMPADGPGAPLRARMSRAMQQTVGNARSINRQQGPVIQAKLNVSQPQEKSEQEAEQAAQKFTHQSGPAPMAGPQRPAPAAPGRVQRSSPADGAAAAPPGMENALQKSKGRGQPLPGGMKEKAGAFFGEDFSGVSIHTDANAAQMSRQVNAQAFTHGKDIYFDAGKFQPNTIEGQKLAVHELTHVVQQGQTNGNDQSVHRQARDSKKPEAEQLTPEEQLDKWLSVLDIRLDYFQDAVNKLDQAGIKTNGELVLVAWHNIEIAQQAELSVIGAHLTPTANPIPAAPVALPKDLQERIDRSRRKIFINISTQRYQGNPVLGSFTFPAADFNAGQHIVERTDQVTWVVKDTASLIQVLKKPEIQTGDQWQAVGLLREHQNPWEFAFMTAVMQHEAVEDRLNKFDKGPLDALAKLKTAQTLIRQDPTAGPTSSVGLLKMAPADGKVILIQPMSPKEIANEIYGIAEKWKDFLAPFNYAALKGADGDTWLPAGTELQVDPYQLKDQYRAVFLVARGARRKKQKEGHDPYISADPEGPAVEGNKMRYTLAWPNTAFATHRVEWWADNDPLAVKEHLLLPKRSSGPVGMITWGGPADLTKNTTWEVEASVPGTHVIRCKLTDPEGKETILSYTQIVMTVEQKSKVELNRDYDWRMGSDELLKNLQDERKKLEKEPGKKDELEALDKQIKGLEDARQKDPKHEMTPVKALYVSKSDKPLSLPLRVFVAPDPEYDVGVDGAYYLKLWDFTLQGMPRYYTAKADRVMEALRALLEEFADKAPYPTGQITFETTSGTLAYTGVYPLTVALPTHGGSTIDSILRGISMVALGVGVAASVVLQPEIAAPAFWIAGVSGGAAATFEIADRLEHGDFEWNLETALNALDIVGALMTAGLSEVLTTTAKGAGRLAIVGRIPKAVDYTQIAVAAGVHLTQLSAAVATGDREKVTQAVLSGLADGAIFLIVHKAGKRLEGLREPGGGRPSTPEQRTSSGTTKPPEVVDPQKPEAPGAKPGTPEYERLKHEGWTEDMLRNRLGPTAQPAVVKPGEPLKAGTYKPEGKERLTSPDEAYQAYNEALARAEGREVGIYRNTQTGEYVVRVGNEHSVSAPYEGNWESVLHYHPNPNNVLNYRMPAPADVQGAAIAAQRAGRPITEFVEYPLPGVGRGKVAYTVIPGKPIEIRIEYARPDGQRVQRKFSSLPEYQAAWGERTHYVDPESKEYQWIKQDLDDYYKYSDNKPSGAPDDAQSAPGTAPKGQTTAGLAKGANVPLPTPAESKKIAEYTEALHQLGKGMQEGNSEASQKARQAMDAIESLAADREGKGGEYNDLLEHIDTLTKARSRIEEGQWLSGTSWIHPVLDPKTGKYIEGIGHKFDCQSTRFASFEGKTYRQVEEALGRPPDKIEGQRPGRVRLTWQLPDQSFIHVDKPGAENESRYEINRLAHVARTAPVPNEKLMLSEGGIGVPTDSTAAHTTIADDDLLNYRLRGAQ